MLLMFDWKDQRANRRMVNYVWKAVGICRVMKKFVVLCAIALISKLSANCDLIDSYTVAVEYNTLLERECSSLMGGGGIYYGKIVEASESSPVSCDGIKRSDGYVIIYGCIRVRQKMYKNV